MNKRDFQEWNEALTRVYCGLLFDFPEFSGGEEVECSFDFENPNYEKIRENYPIEKVAGKGSEFERARRLNHWLAPRLKHNPNFALSKEGKSIPQEGIALLEYSLDRPERSINCVSKSLIFMSCCLALGIYSRRVSLYPASPYDEDNHVVNEIYDSKLGKWIMLDTTVDGYVSDGENPLSVLEMRERYANFAHASVIFPRQDPENAKELFFRNHEINQYYAKNLFYLGVETSSSSMGGGKEVFLIPKGFDAKARLKQCAAYLLGLAEKWGDEFMDGCREYQKSAERFHPKFGTKRLWGSPK